MGVNADPGVGMIKMDLSGDTDLVASAKGACRFIHIGVAGNISFTTLEGEEITSCPVGAGTFPHGAKAIKSTGNGTTATDVYACY